MGVNRKRSLHVVLLIFTLLIMCYFVFLNTGLKMEENNTYARSANSDITIIAIHGGKIEEGTSELADEIASNKYNFFTFYGSEKSDHITSTEYSDSTALALVQKSTKTLSIHGCEGSEKFTYIGGIDKKLVGKVSRYLNEAGFVVENPPDELDGSNRDNIVNKNAISAGVQIELSKGLRKSFFGGPFNWETDDFHKYVNAITSALEDWRNQLMRKLHAGDLEEKIPASAELEINWARLNGAVKGTIVGKADLTCPSSIKLLCGETQN